MKDIPGYEGRYAATEDGRIWSHLTRKYLKFKLAGGTEKGGRYFVVSIAFTGEKPKTKYVHRLVAKAYCDNPEEKKCVNHINGVKTDNSARNLEWVTVQENVNHAVATGLSNSVGVNNSQARLTEGIVDQIRLRYLTTDETQSELAEAFGIHRVMVKAIVTGNAWKHTWKPEYSRPPRWKDRGLQRKGTKYTLQLAAEIRSRYSGGGCTTRSLGSEYGISSSQISDIVNNKIWLDV